MSKELEQAASAAAEKYSPDDMAGERGDFESGFLAGAAFTEKRSECLVEALEYVNQRAWAADDKALAWKWINDFVEVAREALKKFEAGE